MDELNRYDVIVVGAGIAGCTAATLFARDGHRVALVERQAERSAFKKLCTHYIQAGATPVMRRLGIDRAIEQAGGLRNTVDIWTPFGLVREPDMLDADGAPIYGYNLRRSVLDPLLREMASATPGVTCLDGHGVGALTRSGDHIDGVVLNDPSSTTLGARLVVAADGRNSRLAALAGVEPRQTANRRGGVFAHYRNAAPELGTRSRMWMTEQGVAYIFQNDAGVSVVTAMPDHDCWQGFEAADDAALLDFVGRMPGAPDLSRAERVSDVIRMREYPNQSRPPVVDGMALIGDAALSADPLFGVGCGYAFQTGAWLVDATSGQLGEPRALARQLDAYARRHRVFLGGHQAIIADYSRRKRFRLFERLIYTAASRDPRYAERFFRVGMRIDAAWQLLTPASLFAAVRACLRAPAAGGALPAAP